MEVPVAVIKAASGLVNLFGPNFSLLGEKGGKEVYKFDFPKGRFTGYPFLYLYKRETNTATEVTGPRALEIIISFDIE